VANLWQFPPLLLLFSLNCNILSFCLWIGGESEIRDWLIVDGVHSAQHNILDLSVSLICLLPYLLVEVLLLVDDRLVVLIELHQMVHSVLFECLLPVLFLLQVLFSFSFFVLPTLGKQ
jgi:hypothetical protein